MQNHFHLRMQNQENDMPRLLPLLHYQKVVPMYMMFHRSLNCSFVFFCFGLFWDFNVEIDCKKNNCTNFNFENINWYILINKIILYNLFCLILTYILVLTMQKCPKQKSKTKEWNISKNSNKKHIWTKRTSFKKQGSKLFFFSQTTTDLF